MTKESSAKGALLTAGIAFLSAAPTLLVTEKWWVGVIFAFVGVGIIFLREKLKEE